jgi:hypothetical protein
MELPMQGSAALFSLAVFPGHVLVLVPLFRYHACRCVGIAAEVVVGHFCMPIYMLCPA